MKQSEFYLTAKSGEIVYNMKGIQEKLTILEILQNVKNGKLVQLLKNIKEKKDIVDSIEQLDIKDNENLVKNLVKIFKISISCDEQKYIDVIENIAFSQEELYDLLEKDKRKIYLYGERFLIPLDKSGVSYIGIDEPIIEVASESKVDWEQKDIYLENIEFDEKYKEVLLLEGTLKDVIDEIFIKNYSKEEREKIKEKAEMLADYFKGGETKLDIVIRTLCAAIAGGEFLNENK